jgi:hypothetical protein
MDLFNESISVFPVAVLVGVEEGEFSPLAIKGVRIKLKERK